MYLGNFFSSEEPQLTNLLELVKGSWKGTKGPTQNYARNDLVGETVVPLPALSTCPRYDQRIPESQDH